MKKTKLTRYEKSQRRMLEFAAASGILAHSMGHSQDPINKQVRRARLAAKLLIEVYPDVGVSEKTRVSWGRLKVVKNPQN